MELTLERYYKDGRKMSPDYKPKSIPELEELLGQVQNRLDNERKLEQSQNST